MTGRCCWGLMVLVTTTSLGCAMCASPFDYDYAAFGGIRPRSDLRNGRVGSVTDDSSSSEIPLEYSTSESEFTESEAPYQDVPQLDQGFPVDLGPTGPPIPPERRSPADGVIEPPSAIEPPVERRPPVESVPTERGPRRPLDDDLELPEI